MSRIWSGAPEYGVVQALRIRVPLRDDFFPVCVKVVRFYRFRRISLSTNFSAIHVNIDGVITFSKFVNSGAIITRIGIPRMLRDILPYYHVSGTKKSALTVESQRCRLRVGNPKTTPMGLILIFAVLLNGRFRSP